MADKPLTRSERKELERLLRAERDRNRTKEQQQAEAEAAKKIAIPPGVNHQPNTASIGKNQKNKMPDIKQERPKSTNSERVMVLFTGALIIVSVFQWSGLRSQISQTDRALSQTDQTLDLMQLDQRPWLAIGPPTFDTPIKPGLPVGLKQIVRNVGNTPAWVDDHDMSVCIITTGDEGKELPNAVEKFITQNTDKRPFVLIPDAEITYTPPHPESTWGDLSTVGAINTGAATIYILGYVTYKDRSGAHHWSLDCISYNAATGEYRNHDKYNGMDGGPGGYKTALDFVRAENAR